MSVDTLVAHYGLVGLFLGAGIEGEAVVVTGGILAHKGLIPLWGAMLASTAGSCIVDQLWFFAGRHFSHYPWVQRLTQRPAFARATAFLERHPTAFIFGFRFIYGLRTVSPIAIGTMRVPTARFMILNALAAAIWAPLFTMLGYACGEAIDPILERIQSDAIYFVGGAILLAAVLSLGVWLYRSGSAARERP